ncbi:hypothetical protein EJ02DRAFT_478225 [Clathrospora elynae]|uniref:F-box domain-containing protein n=1 Tax=Clathrospora elynae TaxID=706981 RepID=A0A6A5SBW4_9PLEO|nr:hypothetical protein EJ02DRAFT_478225 [Clathrospora elynae]
MVRGSEIGGVKKSYQMVVHGAPPRSPPQASSMRDQASFLTLCSPIITRRHLQQFKLPIGTANRTKPGTRLLSACVSNDMTDAATRTTFFSLPTELRLQIAAYALEQEPYDGFIQKEVPTLRLDPEYKSSSNLSIRLVCRQFADDFTRLAFQNTIFVLSCNGTQAVDGQPDARLKDVRKLAIDCDHRTPTIANWQEFPFNKECLHLDELSITNCGDLKITFMVGVLRRLRNVKRIRFVKHRWIECYRLMGAVLREDHYQRYDAPNAPNLETTWWDWSHNEQENSFIFVAREPKPAMEEQEYMLFIQPKVDEVMESMARLTS